MEATAIAPTKPPVKPREKRSKPKRPKGELTFRLEPGSYEDTLVILTGRHAVIAAVG